LACGSRRIPFSTLSLYCGSALLILFFRTTILLVPLILTQAILIRQTPPLFYFPYLSLKEACCLLSFTPFSPDKPPSFFVMFFPSPANSQRSDIPSGMSLSLINPHPPPPPNPSGRCCAIFSSHPSRKSFHFVNVPSSFSVFFKASPLTLGPPLGMRAFLSSLYPPRSLPNEAQVIVGAAKAHSARPDPVLNLPSSVP